MNHFETKHKKLSSQHKKLNMPSKRIHFSANIKQKKTAEDHEIWKLIKNNAHLIAYLPNSQLRTGCSNCEQHRVRSASGQMSELWSPTVTGEHRERWYP